MMLMREKREYKKEIRNMNEKALKGIRFETVYIHIFIYFVYEICECKFVCSIFEKKYIYTGIIHMVNINIIVLVWLSKIC